MPKPDVCPISKITSQSVKSVIGTSPMFVSVNGTDDDGLTDRPIGPETRVSDCSLTRSCIVANEVVVSPNVTIRLLATVNRTIRTKAVVRAYVMT